MPAGVAILVHALTDNRNRTASAVRTDFNRNGGNLGETGSVLFDLVFWNWDSILWYHRDLG